MLSNNGYALDYLAAEMIGVDPSGNEILQAGIKRGILKESDKISSVGDYSRLPSIAYKLPEKSTPQSKDECLLYKFVSVHPRIKSSRCTACGLCTRACPLSAIGGEGVPEINHRLCLNCLYCYYQCPEKAITLKGERPFLNHLVHVLRRVLSL